jgi:hypothetical protein
MTMPILNQVIKVYAATAVYGFTRAVTYDYDGTNKYYNRETKQFETKPLLITDNVGRITGKTFETMIFWPITMQKDVARLECFARGKDHKEYGSFCWDRD